MAEYEYMLTEGGDLDDCDSCGHDAPLRSFAERALGFAEKDGRRRLCKICSHTLVGNATASPDQYKSVTEMRTMARIANLLLDELTDRRKAIPTPPTT